MHYVHPALRPLGAEYFQDPYEVHARLRAELPAVPVAMPGGNRVWLVTRYDDVRAALADPRLFKDHRKRPGGGSGPLGANMINTDPPDHERLRRLVASAFTMRRVEQMRPRIEKITAALLDEMAGNDEVDLVSAFAFPLPVTVICELLGVPTGDRDSFRAWTGAILGSDPAGSAASAMAGYLTSLVAGKREHPGDDMVTALIAARDNQNRLSEEELVATLWLLLSAGHETTVNLLGSGTLALLTHPATLTRLREDPSLMPAAVEELLRFTSPVNHSTFRMSACPVQYENVLVPENCTVYPAISSANRDPSRFPSPDVLDIDRDTSGHLAFGHGIHYCLGAQLARMEAVIAFGELLSRFPEMELAVPPESIRWRENTLFHGPEWLPVRLRPA